MIFIKIYTYITECAASHTISSSIQYRSLVYMVYGVLAVLTTMGWTYVMLILSHCVLLYSISLVKLRWLCFTAGLITLTTFKMEPFVSWQVDITNSPKSLVGLNFKKCCGRPPPEYFLKMIFSIFWPSICQVSKQDLMTCYILIWLYIVM